MIFLAVSLGFNAENIREHITERRVAEELAENLYREALLDSADAHEAIWERLQVKEKHVDLYIDYVRDSSLNSVSDTFMRHFFAGFLNNVYFEPNDGVLSQLKNSGSLRYLKSSKLQQEIGRYSVAIANVRTRKRRNETWYNSTSGHSC